MRAGELQRLPERERKTKSMYEAEPEGDHPAPVDALDADNVLERHVKDGHGNQRFDERWKPQRVRREVERRRDERDRMRHGEGRDDQEKLSEAAERDDETNQKQ